MTMFMWCVIGFGFLVSFSVYLMGYYVGRAVGRLEATRKFYKMVEPPEVDSEAGAMMHRISCRSR